MPDHQHLRPPADRDDLHLHASAVARDDQGVLLLGPPGAGKSSLAFALIDRGFVLVADDRVRLAGDVATAEPGLEGLIEIRGLGIVRLPHVARAHIVLALDLCHTVARLPEAPPTGTVRGPGTIRQRLAFDPRAPSSAARVSLLLDCLAGFGLPSLVVGGLAAAPTGDRETLRA